MSRRPSETWWQRLNFQCERETLWVTEFPAAVITEAMWWTDCQSLRVCLQWSVLSAVVSIWMLNCITQQTNDERCLLWMFCTALASFCGSALIGSPSVPFHYTTWLLIGQRKQRSCRPSCDWSPESGLHPPDHQVYSLCGIQPFFLHLQTEKQQILP